MNDKTMSKIYLIIVIYTMMIIGITSMCWNVRIKSSTKTVIQYVEVEVEKGINIDTLVQAIIFVESSNKDNAIGDDGKAIGCLQIQPIYIDEVNRLSGYKKYSYSDRTDRETSILIFKDMQDFKNPNYNLHLAIKLHNPKAGYKYHKDIEDKYNELINK